ncbi:MAG: DUF4928 domain-containing protein [Chloroflexi bacterium]|nr:DUF4928 domain-containing protein [Chloroflexota bacterium]
MTKTQETIDLVKQWWNSLTPIKQNNNLPAKGTVAGALVVLETLKVKYVLDIDQHRAKGQSQIKGVGKARVQKILAEFGEMRDFLKEGGRTNRGLAGDVAKLLDALSSAALEPLPPDTRNGILTEVQGFLVGKVSEYFSRERVKIIYDPSTTAWQSIHDILESAKEVGKEGPVAQYLVGAKLALRFPSFNIRNDISSAQDELSGSPGDFLVSDTVFHVTVAPTPGHFEKCKRNVEMGYNVYLLVPDRILVGTRQNVEDFLPKQITTQSIESFVAQNLEELSRFSKGELVSGFRQLLEEYNDRVDQVEPDKSMLIELPRNLQSQ